jgi:hypothetical protein
MASRIAVREESSGSSTARTQALVFDGGCVTSKVVIPSQFDHDLVIADVDAALVLVPGRRLNAQVAPRPMEGCNSTHDLRVCEPTASRAWGVVAARGFDVEQHEVDGQTTYRAMP